MKPTNTESRTIRKRRQLLMKILVGLAYLAIGVLLVGWELQEQGYLFSSSDCNLRSTPQVENPLMDPLYAAILSLTTSGTSDRVSVVAIDSSLQVIQQNVCPARAFTADLIAAIAAQVACAPIDELVAALDEFIPIPPREIDKPFLMPIEDVFSISGRGTVVTGRVERGIVKVGETVEIIGIKPTSKTTVTGVEMFRKLLDQGQAGDNIGALLRGIEREGIERGQVLAKPGSVTPHTVFVAEAYILTKDEGGRHTPFFANYRPQFYFRTTDVTGIVKLPEGTEMVMPGDTISVEVELIVPIAMEEKLRFAIREGGRTVGAGVVAKIIK